MRLVTLGVGAMNSPQHAPAGLLVAHGGVRVMIDGGPQAEPEGRLAAWLVTDERGELMPAIRRSAAARGLVPQVRSLRLRGLVIEPRAVIHTSHPSYGYRIRAGGRTVVWAPEFLRFPLWARGADLVFAEAAAWKRPIRFADGVGGHAAVLEIARAARRSGIKRLVFAHIGRPTLRALAQGARPSFGSFAADGQVFSLRGSATRPSARRGRRRPRRAGRRSRPAAARRGTPARRPR